MVVAERLQAGERIVDLGLGRVARDGIAVMRGHRHTAAEAQVEADGTAAMT